MSRLGGGRGERMGEGQMLGKLLFNRRFNKVELAYLEWPADCAG